MIDLLLIDEKDLNDLNIVFTTEDFKHHKLSPVYQTNHVLIMRRDQDTYFFEQQEHYYVLRMKCKTNV